MKEILAVDDNIVDNLINEIILKKTFPDYKITVFSDPSDALAFIRENKFSLPELILLDINMPIVSGWDILEELSTYEKPLNVFMLTSSVFKEDEEKARKYACLKDYFVKPLDNNAAERMRTYLSENNI